MRYEAVRPERSVAVAVNGGVDVSQFSVAASYACARACIFCVARSAYLFFLGDGGCRRDGPADVRSKVVVCLCLSDCSVVVVVVVVVDVKSQGMSVWPKRLLQHNHPLLGETKLTPEPCLSMGCAGQKMRGGP